MFIKNSLKLSVILPVYNVEKYLEDCLKSIVNQSYKEFELIAINDCSTDSSLSILKKYQNQIKDMKIIDLKENSGLSIVRNIGLEKATGNIISFIDSDDLINKYCFENCLRYFNFSKADLLIFKHQKFYTNTISDTILNKISLPICKRVEYPSKKLKYSDIGPVVWNKIYRRELIGNTKYIPNILWEDGPFTCEIILKKPKIAFLDNVFYFYRFNPNSLSNSELTEKTANDYFIALNREYDLIKDKDEYEIVKKCFFSVQMVDIFSKCEKDLKIKRNMLNNLCNFLQRIDPIFYNTLNIKNTNTYSNLEINKIIDKIRKDFI